MGVRIRMWEAVAAPGRLADLEAAASGVVRAAMAASVPASSSVERAEASSDGESRVVIMVWSEGEPAAIDEAIDPALCDRAHAWTFTRL